MARPKTYQKTRIEKIESRIALWELRGGVYADYAQGLRLFFGDAPITEARIEAHKADFAKSNPDLAKNYKPKPDLLPTPKPKRGRGRPKGTGKWIEIQVVKKGGKEYKYKREVTLHANGKRTYKRLGKA